MPGTEPWHGPVIVALLALFTAGPWWRWHRERRAAKDSAALDRGEREDNPCN